MVESRHKPSISIAAQPLALGADSGEGQAARKSSGLQVSPIVWHSRLVVGLLLICALILMPNRSQSLGSQPSDRLNVSSFVKGDHQVSVGPSREGDPIGDLIDRLSRPESATSPVVPQGTTLPAAFLSVTQEDL